MPVRLVALDIDGTLLRNDFSISRRTKKALKEVRRRGVTIVVASGRRPGAAVLFAREILSAGPVISLDGALIQMGPESAALQSFPLDPEIGRVAVELAMARRQAVAAFTAHHFYLTKERRMDIIMRQWRRRRVFYRPNGLRHAFWELWSRPTPLTDPEAMSQETEPFLKLSMFGRSRELLEIRQELEDRFAGRFAFTLPPEEGTEVVGAGVTKALALEVLLGRLGLTWQDVMAVGDNWNDESMIVKAGTGVLMGNAPVGMRQLPCHHTTGNQQEGLALALERFVLDDRV